MKFHRMMILAAAACAGTVVYKLQKSFTEGDSGQRSFYSSVAGPGSLARTIRASSSHRGEGNSFNNYNAPSSTYDSSQEAGSRGFRPGAVGYSHPQKGNNILAGGGKASDDVVPDDIELIQAAAKGDKAWLERRLAFHVKVDSRDYLRRTALMFASWGGYDDICNRLLAAGANPSFRDRDGNNAFDYAASRGLIDTLHFLLQRTHMSDDDHYEEYARIIQASFAGDASRLPAGSGKLASINRINPEGQAPLHIAAGNGSVELMEALIKRGAQVNIANNNHQTPLHWAAWNNQAGAVQLLLDHGADIAMTDLAGNTPLILAAQNGSADAVNILLSKGADKYVSNKDGKNASIAAEDAGFAALATTLK